MIKEYRDFTDDTPRSRRTVLREGVNRFGSACRVESISEGWASAGSVACWQPARFAYAFTDKSGTIGGQQYLTEAEAVSHFERAAV